MFRKLHTKTTIIFLLVALLPLITIGFLYLTQIQDSLEKTAYTNIQHIAIETGNEIERFVSQRRGDIEVLASNSVIRSENTSRDEKLAVMLDVQRTYRVYEDVTLIDKEGNVIASTNYSYWCEWSGNEWFMRSMEGEIVVSDAHISLYPYRVVVVFLAPVINEKNETISVVAGQMDMKYIWEITDSINVGENGFVFLINKEGKIVANPNKEIIFDELRFDHPVREVLEVRSGTTSYEDTDGNRMIAGYTPILGEMIYDEEGCWGVVVTQPESEVLAIAMAFQQQILILVLVYLVIVLFASFFLARSIARPIAKLTDAADAASIGDFDKEIDVKSKDEIGVLADSIKRMIVSLKIAIMDFEKIEKEKK
jgi:methyl-accepting chemotaxis protein